MDQKAAVDAARALLAAYDGFLAGKKLSAAEWDIQKMVAYAGAFAAEAYEQAPGGGPDVHALIRSFLVAIIDPASPELDYLRKDSRAGSTARDAAALLSSITKGREGEG